MSDEETENVLEMVRRYLSDDAPVDWQRLKAALPSQREWLETNEQIEATLYAMAAGTKEASTDALKELKARYNETLEKLLLERLDSGPSIRVTPEYRQEFRARCIERLRECKRFAE
ncbi:MAG: hypothetical protein H0T92_07685 [Pyrinomonadaceae bacterium]|nr:hypothetical protein [Pyrinomonadaceae bacterium]